MRKIGIVASESALNLYARYILAEDLGSHAKARRSRFLKIRYALGDRTLTVSDEVGMRRGTILFWLWVVALVIISTIAIWFALNVGVDLGIFVATAVAAVSYPMFALAERYIWTAELGILRGRIQGQGDRLFREF